ncbi:hugX domain protein, partial [Glaesserella parasuis 84-15995]
MNSYRQQITQLLAEKPNMITLEIAEKLDLPEGQVLCNLPSEFVR